MKCLVWLLRKGRKRKEKEKEKILDFESQILTVWDLTSTPQIPIYLIYLSWRDLFTTSRNKATQTKDSKLQIACFSSLFISSQTKDINSQDMEGKDRRMKYYIIAEEKEYLFGHATSLIRWIENLIVKHREIERQAQPYRMSRGQIS